MNKEDIKGLIVMMIIIVGIIGIISFVGYLWVVSDNQQQNFFKTECPRLNLTIEYNSIGSNRIADCYKIQDNILIKYKVSYLNGTIILMQDGGI